MLSENDPGRATLIAEEKGWLRDAFFDFDSSILTSAAQQNLTSSADWLRGNRRFHVLIEGHCDERGTEKYNLALGDHRAWEAKEYLSQPRPLLAGQAHTMNGASARRRA
ncbi:MAG: OmpA family protein [Acidobacteriota bacterium]|nr:OmpA family protein [Acidobacteriota bacterium]